MSELSEKKKSSRLKSLKLRLDADLVDAFDEFQDNPSQLTLEELTKVKAERDLLESLMKPAGGPEPGTIVYEKPAKSKKS